VIALVLIAGALGAVIRFLVVRLVATPWAVLIVNVVGSFAGGVLIGTTSGDLQLILLTGLCGGLTTFSTLSVETVQLVLEGRTKKALLSMGLNLVLGVGAAALGLALATLLAPAG
jgi:CrcB protein